MTQRREHLDTLAIALLVACCLFWGFQQVLVKATLSELPPVFQAAIRFAGATALLWGWCNYKGIALFERDGTLGAGLLAGVLFCAEFVCIYLGLQHTSASRLTIFLYTAPFWVALLLPFVSLQMGEVWVFEWSSFALVSILLQTVAGAFASYLVWMWLLGRYPATKLSVFVFLTPIFAMVMGAWWLREPVTQSALVALAGVALGIVLVNKKPAPQPAPAEE